MTRTCVYDRANLGRSDPDPGPRGLSKLVGDLERMLQAAEVPGPYVLVGTSGGGFITAGYAVAHPQQVAGMVFIDTGAPLQNPPREIVEATDPTNPANVERRDYLQVEKDAWAARKPIGDIPVTVISVKFSGAALNESPFPSERKAMRRKRRAPTGLAHPQHAREAGRRTYRARGRGGRSRTSGGHDPRRRQVSPLTGMAIATEV